MCFRWFEWFGGAAESLRCDVCVDVFCVQDDSEDSETDGDEDEDTSQTSTNTQPASFYHRYTPTPDLWPSPAPPHWSLPTDLTWANGLYLFDCL